MCALTIILYTKIIFTDNAYKYMHAAEGVRAHSVYPYYLEYSQLSQYIRKILIIFEGVSLENRANCGFIPFSHKY